MLKKQHEMTKEYLLKLAPYGRDLLNKLPIEIEPQPLEYALHSLSPTLDRIKPIEISTIDGFVRPKIEMESTNLIGVGLNSVGMLSDRFTILIVKEWCLRNKGERNEFKAKALFDNQTLDIIEAMSRANPDSSSMNSKITHIKGDASASTWSEAFYGLLATNLVLWESQEILYVKDINDLPSEELRSYIKWFSYGNIRRNEYIQLCEEFYWTS